MRFLEVLSSDDTYHYVSILIDKDQSARLEDILESIDFNVEPNRNYDKTNIEVISDFKAEIDALEKRNQRNRTIFYGLK